MNYNKYKTHSQRVHWSSHENMKRFRKCFRRLKRSSLSLGSARRKKIAENFILFFTVTEIVLWITAQKLKCYLFIHSISKSNKKISQIVKLIIICQNHCPWLYFHWWINNLLKPLLAASVEVSWRVRWKIDWNFKNCWTWWEKREVISCLVWLWISATNSYYLINFIFTKYSKKKNNQQNCCGWWTSYIDKVIGNTSILFSALIKSTLSHH